ncbi:MAG: RNA polymerase factor sigma-54 [Bacteriovoracaceae bacterium]
MAVKLGQNLKQTQSLLMTPQLQQAIKLLTLTHMEMTNIIAQEMVENPMLEEMGQGDGEDYKVETLEIQNQEAGTDNFDEKPIMSNDQDDFDWKSYVADDSNSYTPPNMVGPASSEEAPNYENMVSKGQSLQDHLEWQIRMEELLEDELQLALLIIGNINDDGYLDCDFSDLVSQVELTPEVCNDVLEMVQRLDPIGCGARNLTDCLLAQAKIMEERSPLLEKLIRDYLEDLRCNNYAKIAKETGVNSETVEKTAELLQQFHPKPGRLVSSSEIHYVVPDIYVKKVGEEFEVVVNDDGVPRLKVSNHYKEILETMSEKKTEEEKKALEYVEEKYKSAIWLIKSIQNRQKTIVKVAQAIVRRQQDFFKKGPKFLKPMILKDIAEEIEMHESTVSRVTTNKFMHTPIGVFELKYFFNAGIGGGASGEDVSSEVLKLKIQELIENESPKRPLSDQKVADILKREGLNVARRTIAKYREALGILSSAKRKIKA